MIIIVVQDLITPFCYSGEETAIWNGTTHYLQNDNYIQEWDYTLFTEQQHSNILHKIKLIIYN